MSSLTRRLTGVRSDIAFKAPVRVATTANITLSGFQTIDGVTLASGDYNLRVLVKNQTDQTANGIYLAQTGTWSRDRDFDENTEIANGTEVRVQQGTLGQGLWILTTADPITLGTSSIVFASEASLLGAAYECDLDAGQPLTVGFNAYIIAEFPGTISKSTIVADQTGSITVDVRSCTYAQFDGSVTHPVAADTICGNAPPTISAGTKAQDTTLTGWTTSVPQGNVLQFIVTSTSGTITKATVSLRVSRTS